MALFSVKITGDKAIDKALRNLEAKVVKKVLRSAMRKAMKFVKKQVEAEAPVGETGVLSGSVRIAAAKRSRKYIGIDVSIGIGFFIGKTYYAGFIEFGTSEIEANPFMARAFEKCKEEARKIAIEAVREGLKKYLV